VNETQQALFHEHLDRLAKRAPPRRRYRVALAAGVVRGTVARGDDTAAFVMCDRLRDLVVPNPTPDEIARQTVFDIAAGRWADYIELAHECEVWARGLLEQTGTDELDRKARACAEAFGHPEWCQDPRHPVWQMFREVAAATEKDHAENQEAEQGRPAAVRPTPRG
jgi:hypothetical protein